MGAFMSAASSAASVSRLAIVIVLSATALTLAAFAGRAPAHAAGTLVDAMVVPGYVPSPSRAPAYAAPADYAQQPAYAAPPAPSSCPRSRAAGTAAASSRC